MLEENFFPAAGAKIRSGEHAAGIPGGVWVLREGIERAMDAGFDMMALARAVIHDPDFLLKSGTGYKTVET